MAAIPPTSDDAFLGGALRILQPCDGYRAGLDAVLLAATARGRRILDVGAGVGVVGLAIARRLAPAHVTLVERDGLLARLARANIERNELVGRVRVVEADLVQPLSELGELYPLAESFDEVLANPPFHIQGRGSVARHPMKEAARAMAEGDLDRWFRFMAAMARPGGKALMINRTEALTSMLAAAAGRFGGLILLPIHSKVGEAANRVLLAATKGSRAPLTLLPGMVLHDSRGGFRREIKALLRGSRALELEATLG